MKEFITRIVELLLKICTEEILMEIIVYDSLDTFICVKLLCDFMFGELRTTRKLLE